MLDSNIDYVSAKMSLRDLPELLFARNSVDPSWLREGLRLLNQRLLWVHALVHSRVGLL